MSDTLSATTVTYAGDNGDTVQAYFATTEGDSRRGGVVVIHHLPGYDRATKEMVRRFAELGYDAVMPNLYSREGLDVPPEDAAAAARAKGGVPDEQVVGDVTAAVAYLRALPTCNGKVGVIGFCSGGRQSVLIAANVDVDAAVDCYGGGVVGPTNPNASVRFTNLEDQLPNLRAPLLGLFGNEDRSPTPELVDRLELLLKEHGKTYEFHRYDGAGHGFLAPDRPAYNVAAAVDAWERIVGFYGRYLGTD